MSDVQIAVIDQQDTQIVLAVPGVQGATGSSIPSGGTTDQVLRKNSSTDYDANWAQVTSAMIANGTIVNDDINNSAAIAGTKISPDFGGQAVTTTGQVSAARVNVTSNTPPSNGIYLPSANNVAISTGGSGRLFVDASGNVGVGVSPSAIFEAAGSEPVFGLNHHVTQYLTSTKAYNATPGGGIALRYKYNSANDYTYGAGISFEKDNTVDGDFGSHITIQTRPNNGSATERLRITSAGLVGIGTSSPATNLEVYGAQGTILEALRLRNQNAGVAGVQQTFWQDYLVAAFTASRNGLDGRLALQTTDTSGNLQDRLFIDGSGRVGIGTSGPSVRFQVQDSIAGGSDGTVATLHNVSDTGADTRYVGLNFRIGSDNGTSAIRAYRTNSVTNYETNLSFWTNPAGATQTPLRAMTIDSYQRVGIGTATPQGQCESATAGDTYCFVANNTFGGTLQKYLSLNSGSTQLGNISRLNSGNDIAFNATYGAVAFGTGPSGTATEKCRIDSSGRLLVGTSSTSATSTAVFASRSDAAAAPLLALHTTESTVTDGANFATLSFGNTATTGTNAAAFIQGQRDGGTWTNNSSMPGRLVFSSTKDGSASPDPRVRINNAGNVALCADGEMLYGTTTLAAGTTSALVDLYSGGTVGSFGSGTRRFLIFTNGNTQNSNGSFTQLSDAKLKENIVDANSQWADIKSIRIRNWNFKAETGHETHRQIGPIAQELEQVCPGLVYETPDRDADGNNLGTVTKGINQSIMYMKAVKALQEAMERIETLEQRLNDAGIN